MFQTLLAALFAALLVAISTLAARRWGPRTGGVISAFPAIVGPVLVLVAVEHGSAAAARNADGTLLGLVGLAAFALAYGWTAQRVGWTASLLSGWVAAAVASLLAAGAAGGLGAGAAGRFGALGGLLAASVSLWVAYRALPHPEPEGLPVALAVQSRPVRPVGIPLRMGATAAIVLALAGAVAALGPFVGGILAALPVLASVLAGMTHRDTGPAAAVGLLRGTLAGMAGFVAFCEIVGLLVTRAPLVATFGVATVAALAAQAPALRDPTRRDGSRPARHRRQPLSQHPDSING